MGKDLLGKDLGKRYRQRADGLYEYRVYRNRRSISIYNRDIDALKKSTALFGRFDRKAGM